MRECKMCVRVNAGLSMVCWYHSGSVGVGVGKYGKVCYTNLLTQAQVPYTNFDFPKFGGVNLRHESKLGCARIQKLLGFGICSSAIF